MPIPPYDMLMPAQANLWFTVIAYLCYFVVAGLLVRKSVADSTVVPLCFLLGGSLSFLTEPFFDIVVCAWYPNLNTPLYYTAFGVSVPLWLIPAWGIYMGGQTYLVFESMKSGVSPSRLFALFPIFWLTNVSFEIPGLLLGIYTYYGPQAFKIYGFPAWMGMSNAIMPIVIATVFYMLRSHFTGPRALFMIPLYPGVSVAAGGIAAWPMWLSLNSGFSAQANAVVTCVVLGLCLLTLQVCGRLVSTTKQNVSEPVATPSW